MTFLSPSPSLCFGLLSHPDFAVGFVLTGCPLLRTGLYVAPVELGNSNAQNLLASLAAEVPLSDFSGELCART